MYSVELFECSEDRRQSRTIVWSKSAPCPCVLLCSAQVIIDSKCRRNQLAPRFCLIARRSWAVGRGCDATNTHARISRKSCVGQSPECDIIPQKGRTFSDFDFLRPRAWKGGGPGGGLRQGRGAFAPIISAPLRKAVGHGPRFSPNVLFQCSVLSTKKARSRRRENDVFALCMSRRPFQPYRSNRKVILQGHLSTPIRCQEQHLDQLQDESARTELGSRLGACRSGQDQTRPIQADQTRFTLWRSSHQPPSLRILTSLTSPHIGSASLTLASRHITRQTNGRRSGNTACPIVGDKDPSASCGPPTSNAPSSSILQALQR